MVFVKNMRTFAGNLMANGTAAVQYGGVTPRMFPDVFPDATKRLRRRYLAHDPVYKHRRISRAACARGLPNERLQAALLHRAKFRGRRAEALAEGTIEIGQVGEAGRMRDVAD